MYTITVKIYKYDQVKWQEQVLLDASTKAEAMIYVQLKDVVINHFAYTN